MAGCPGRHRGQALRWPLPWEQPQQEESRRSGASEEHRPEEQESPWLREPEPRPHPSWAQEGREAGEELYQEDPLPAAEFAAGYRDLSYHAELVAFRDREVSYLAAELARLYRLGPYQEELLVRGFRLASYLAAGCLEELAEAAGCGPACAGPRLGSSGAKGLGSATPRPRTS